MNRALTIVVALVGLAASSAASARAELNLVYLGRATNYAGDIAISGNYAYTAGDVSGVWIYNISDPAHPVSIAHTNNSGAGNSITVSGNYAYLANGVDGLRIYDVSDPTNPKNVGHSTTNYGGRAYDVVISGNYAYVANADDGVRVFDVSDSANPINVGHTVTNYGGQARGIALSANYAFIANYMDGLRIYDASNPTNLIPLGHTNDGGFTFSVTVHGNYAYANAVGTLGVTSLYVYDVSDPNNPAKVSTISSLPPTVAPHPVTFWRNLPFMIHSIGGGLRVYEVSDPSHPTLVASTNTTNARYFGVAMSENYIFEAVQNDGVKSFSLLGPKLAITPTNAASISVSWAIPPTGFALQQSSDLTTNWLDVTNNPAVFTNRNQVVLQPSAVRAFFRLKLQ